MAQSLAKLFADVALNWLLVLYTKSNMCRCWVEAYLWAPLYAVVYANIRHRMLPRGRGDWQATSRVDWGAISSSGSSVSLPCSDPYRLAPVWCHSAICTLLRFLILDIQLVPRLPKQNPTCVAIIDPQHSGELAWLGWWGFHTIVCYNCVRVLIAEGCVNQRARFLFIQHIQWVGHINNVRWKVLMMLLNLSEYLQVSLMSMQRLMRTNRSIWRSCKLCGRILIRRLMKTFGVLSLMSLGK